MIEGARGLGLAQHPHPLVDVLLGGGGQELDRDLAPQPLVDADVDHAHTAGAELLPQSVVGDLIGEAAVVGVPARSRLEPATDVGRRRAGGSA